MLLPLRVRIRESVRAKVHASRLGHIIGLHKNDMPNRVDCHCQKIFPAGPFGPRVKNRREPAPFL